MTSNTVIEKAKELGFFCQINKENNYEIFSKIPTETWKLTKLESRWILSINNIPQLSLDRDAAIAFLVNREEER